MRGFLALKPAQLGIGQAPDLGSCNGRRANGESLQLGHSPAS
ncbi:hypothetical protein HMPREF3198_01793 [Winkia neuii]|nr:hypothetical protein HMPREF3198_01793 [Winkia neuii]